MFKVVSLAPPFYFFAKSAAAQPLLANWPELHSGIGFIWPFGASIGKLTLAPTSDSWTPLKREKLTSQRPAASLLLTDGDEV